MKKIIICLVTIFIVVMAIFFNWYTTKIQTQKEIEKFNFELEQLIDGTITGVDVTTVINKAINNNEQNLVSKTKDKLYENNGENSIEIYIKLEENGKYYPMEALNQIGISGFTKAYGSALFKSSKIERHKNGRISKIDFEITTINN